MPTSPAPSSTPRRVSMESIAKDLGVSVATVSRALNGKPGISDQLRAKVEARLEQHAYRRRRSQGNPRKGRSRLNTVAFIVSDDLFQQIMEGDDFYGRHLIAVQKAITDAGLYPLLIGCHQDLNAEGMPRCVAERQVQAVISESWSVDLIDRLARELPVVLFNRTAPNWTVDTVATDMHAAALSQLQYLYDLGHRRIAMFRVTPPSYGWEDACYWQQYLSFHHENQLPVPPELTAPIVFGANGEREAIRCYIDRILKMPQRPTAILTYDGYAEALFETLAEHGLKVPDEMSVVGFNDTRGVADLAVPLTTYRQDFDALAREAMRLLLDRAASPGTKARLVRMGGSPVIRASAVPPPQGMGGPAPATPRAS